MPRKLTTKERSQLNDAIDRTDHIAKKIHEMSEEIQNIQSEMHSIMVDSYIGSLNPDEREKDKADEEPDRKSPREDEQGDDEEEPELLKLSPPEFVKTDSKQRFIGNKRSKGILTITFHYNAGRPKPETPTDAIGCLESRYSFITLDQDGRFFLPRDFTWDKWGYHTGKVNNWRYGSEHALGVEVINAGKLHVDEKENVLFPWYNTLVDKKGRPIRRNGKRQIRSMKDHHWKKEECRYISKNRDNLFRGWYLPYTMQQELAMISLDEYMEILRPEYKSGQIFGHDEICKPKGRKTDPGGCLSMSMPEFREVLTSKNKIDTYKRYSDLV